MQNTLTQQLGQLFTQLQNQLTPEQKTTIINAMAALQHGSNVLTELEKADSIIHNCINAMTDNQRFKVAQKNGQQGISDAWAYRNEPRKAAIARAKRIMGV